jgi:hypothetical protein
MIVCTVVIRGAVRIVMETQMAIIKYRLFGGGHPPKNTLHQ